MSQPLYNKSLFIFRRDLRLQDNTALIKCLNRSKKILMCFILDPRQITKANKYKSNNAIQFMVQSLVDLRFQLGGRLNIYQGLPHKVVETLIKKHQIEAVWCNMDYTPFSRQRDQALHKMATKHHVDFISREDVLLNPILTNPVLNKAGKFYEKFTPFYRAASLRRILRPQRVRTKRLVQKCLVDPASLRMTHLQKLYRPNAHAAVKGGRQEAKKLLLRLQSKKTKLKNYTIFRNRLTFKTTMLSAHNKFGTVSIREVYYAIKRSRGLTSNDKKTLIRQLFWRDFYTYVIWFTPQALTGPFKTKFKKLKWRSLQTQLGKKYWLAWIRGKTGFPIVDACMHQLNTTGYLHNRGRMIVSNFLIHDLGINWQHGERYFATKLIDYDPIQNNQGWQFSSSTGASAQDWFRIMNPWSQQQRFDPDSTYIRTWLPVFKKVPEFEIFNWQERRVDKSKSKSKLRSSNSSKLRSSNSSKLRSYPEPIVDHDQARLASLAKYRAVLKLK